MHLVYDGLVFAMQSAGGVRRYLRELLPRVAALGGHRVSLLLRFGRNGPRELRNVATVPFWLLPDHMGGQGRLRSAIYRLLRPLERAMLCRRLGRPDVYHPSYYTQPWLVDLPSVVTLYDLIHERFPQQFSRPEDERFRRAKADALRRAAHVICISQTTRRDAVELLGLPEQKISVIPLAADHRGAPPAAEPVTRFEQPTVLYVGSRAGYKNFDALARAMSRRAELRVRLHLVGGEPMGDLAHRWPNLSVCQEFADDARLWELYQRAWVVACPSLWEGFGLPVLEALRAGAVVACSNCGSLPEVVGDCAEFFDPRDSDSIASALVRALSLSPAQRSDWSARARARAALFSWDRTVAETMTVYRRVVHS